MNTESQAVRELREAWKIALEWVQKFHFTEAQLKAPEAVIAELEAAKADMTELKIKLAWYESHKTTAQCDLTSANETVTMLQSQLAAVTRERETLGQSEW